MSGSNLPRESFDRGPVVSPALPPYRRRISYDNHSRPECLQRPGEWCVGIGDHPGRCSGCPAPPAEAPRMTKLRAKWCDCTNGCKYTQAEKHRHKIACRYRHGKVVPVEQITAQTPAFNEERER